ncbi:hypothetical protein C8035_v001693 [Colletotrichum spinosum]|uniref:Nephrocystin 3-like N-terminal domain-containing protein n=1 Tax=Colletotrichum spinosum TaxID=1347390 RepID=A0A4R8QF10_9PEZI|nr:hypothetical protein C8035_v001693 [Colletotrichum spinosum]
MGQHNDNESHRPSRIKGKFWRSKPKETPPDPERVDFFLRRRVDSFQTTPPGPTQFDHDQGRYKAQDEIAVRDLETIIEAHDNDPETEIRLSKTSWDTVLTQMADAKRVREGKTHVSSKLAKGSDVLSSFINLIPEESGMGVLKGGLALIFDATKKHDENRGKILEAFETMPESIITMNTAYKLLEPDEEDAEFRDEFLIMLVTDIPALVKILLGQELWYRRIVDILLLKIPETSTIDDILARWNRRLSGLKEHVERLKLQLQATFSADLKSIKTSQSSVAGDVKSIKEGQSGLSEDIKTVGSDIRSLLSEEAIQKALMGALQKERKSQAAGLSRTTNIYVTVVTNFLEDADSRNHDLHQDNLYLGPRAQEPSRRRSVSSIRSAADRRTLSPLQLLGVLGVSPDDSWDDMDHVLRQADSFGEDARGKAQWLLKTSEFDAWLSEETSSVLLVDGSAEPSLVSPLSGLCGGIAGALGDNANHAVLFFFSGLHAEFSAGRTRAGPVAMLRHLIAQLLLSPTLPEPDLRLLSGDLLLLLQDCRRGDLKTLCAVFVRLVKQVPPRMTVFCVVDGVSWYEQDPWLADLHYVATALEVLARKCSRGGRGAFKVLMTSPAWSMEVVKLAKPGTAWRHVSLAACHDHPGYGRGLIDD